MDQKKPHQKLTRRILKVAFDLTGLFKEFATFCLPHGRPRTASSGGGGGHICQFYFLFLTSTHSTFVKHPDIIEIQKIHFF